MTSKHTPGPWVVHDHPTDPYQYGHYVTTADGLTVCSVAHQLPGRSPHGAEEATRAANARLIAAAPELLEALEGLLDDVYGLMRESEGVAGLHLNGDVADWASLDEGGRFERLSNMSGARAAIAKATGEV